MKDLVKSRYLTIAVLVVSFFLILARPAITAIMDRKDLGFHLGLDYGFSLDWYKDLYDRRPLRMSMPEDSIGLDFLNIDSCLRSIGLKPEIYEWRCVGDPFERPYTYPPLLTVSFLWILLFHSHIAVGLWSLAVLMLVFATTYFWSVLSQRKMSGARFNINSKTGYVFAVLFMFSYPSTFSFERGNSDALVLVLVSLAAWALLKRRWFWLAFVLSWAALLKVYPAFLFISVFLAVMMSSIGWRKKGGQDLLQANRKFVLGSIAGILIVVLPLFAHYLYFLNKVLPVLSKLNFNQAGCLECHSWPVAYGVTGIIIFLALWALSTICLIRFFHRWIQSRSEEHFTYVLLSFSYISAIMVYIPNTSYDYSLILLIPLFCVMSLAQELKGWLMKTGLLALLMGALLPRWVHTLLFWRVDFSTLLLLQTMGLGLILLYMLRTAFVDRGTSHG